LIFPIINAFDEVVAFGGRLLEKTDFAKYKNTKETLLFNKSKTLYNINLLKKLKRTQKIEKVIIVEGYMDTISLYQAGFENVVASMGTALTKEQARLIKRYSDTALISYDGDFAGQKNNLRGLEILKDEGLNVKVVPLPEGADPDDVVKQGKEAYQKCLDEALPLIDYKLLSLEKKFDLSRVEEKRKFVSEALKVVSTADSESVKEELLKRLREKTKISYQALERDLSTVKKDDKDDALDTPMRVEIRETSGESSVTDKASRFVLAAKLFSLPYAKDFDLSEIEFTSSVHKVIAEYVIEKERANDRVRPSELFEFLDENCPEFNEILDLNYGDKLSGEIAERFFVDSVRTLRRESVEKEIAELNKAYSKETDIAKRKEIAQKLQACIQKRNALKKT
jgi:DNA primase